MLLPDENSLMHDILEKHQKYMWRRCTGRFIITLLPLHKFGWKLHDNITFPVWYTYPQLPKCFRKYDKSAYETDNNDRNPSAENNSKKDNIIETPPVYLLESPAKNFC